MFVTALLITCFIIWFFWALFKRPKQILGVICFLTIFVVVCLGLFVGFIALIGAST